MVEIVFVGLELFFFYKIVRVFFKIIKKYKEYRRENYFFFYVIDVVFDIIMKRGKLIDVILIECKLIYYVFLLWCEKVLIGKFVYLYYKKIGVIGVYIMIIYVIVIESIGFYYLLY